ISYRNNRANGETKKPQYNMHSLTHSNSLIRSFTLTRTHTSLTNVSFYTKMIN
uniref:Uncharacterized protein n=1 Tax=Amphimedon queenslandica TaxID=400682 RepID=A0A1X7TK76_AMPQE